MLLLAIFVVPHFLAATIRSSLSPSSLIFGWNRTSIPMNPISSPQQIDVSNLSNLSQQLKTAKAMVVSHKKELDLLRTKYEKLVQKVDGHVKENDWKSSKSAFSAHLEALIERLADRNETEHNELHILENLQKQQQQRLEELQKDEKQDTFDLNEWKNEVIHTLRREIQAELARAAQTTTNPSIDSTTCLNERNGTAKIDQNTLVSVMKGAITEYEAQKRGSVDFALLANGAHVLYTER